MRELIAVVLAGLVWYVDGSFWTAAGLFSLWVLFLGQAAELNLLERRLGTLESSWRAKHQDD